MKIFFIFIFLCFYSNGFAVNSKNEHAVNTPISIEQRETESVETSWWKKLPIVAGVLGIGLVVQRIIAKNPNHQIAREEAPLIPQTQMKDPDISGAPPCLIFY